MEKLFNWVSIITGVAGGIAVRLLGGFDKVFCVLLVMMVLDYVSGVVKAVHQKRLSSEIGYKGLLKKVTVLLVVAAANAVGQIVSDNVAVREMVIMFYAANEGISLMENVAAVSNVIPPRLKEILLQLRGDKHE
ncbi:MAG: phage holin family protein [Clostridia bacterium]|nr:phage holin family protein [Clostridia bacterium]